MHIMQLFSDRIDHPIQTGQILFREPLKILFFESFGLLCEA